MGETFLRSMGAFPGEGQAALHQVAATPRPSRQQTASRIGRRHDRVTRNATHCRCEGYLVGMPGRRQGRGEVARHQPPARATTLAAAQRGQGGQVRGLDDSPFLRASSACAVSALLFSRLRRCPPWPSRSLEQIVIAVEPDMPMIPRLSAKIDRPISTSAANHEEDLEWASPADQADGTLKISEDHDGRASWMPTQELLTSGWQLAARHLHARVKGKMLRPDDRAQNR